MKSGRIFFAALSLSPLVLVGCGGGGGGGNTHNPTSVTVDPSGQTISFAAFQDGAGTWTPITAGADGKFHGAVTDTQGRYGFVIVDNASPQTVHIIEGTTSEVNTFTSPVVSNPTRTVSGT